MASALVMPVQAAGVQRIYDGLSANQYLQIMIAALILVAVFIGIFYVIGKRNARRTKVNPVARNVALILAILYLTVGTLLLITDFIVLIEPMWRQMYSPMLFRYSGTTSRKLSLASSSSVRQASCSIWSDSTS
ncbi:hypothetical protein [Methanogenium cariaci]|uniref:hypothetical protein n=1 Tax=Methanogenium cariaci TaxID=2197 RepID=UPI0012F62B4C|nr:hypothetical protein [Methanogenium cariaci]